MRSRVRPRPVGIVLAVALAAAGLGIAGTPPTPVSASCAEIPLIPPIAEGDSLFIGTVVAADLLDISVHVDRWLVGPVATGTIPVRGRGSLDPGMWSSGDWEPVGAGSYVIAATPDERGVLQTNLCRVSPLTPEVFAAVQARWPSASPAPSSEPVFSSMVEDDTFRLTITTPRSTYTSTEAIPVSAILQFKRSQPTTIAGAGSGPLGFGIEQLDGPVDNGPASRLSCHREDWAPNEIRVLPFTKSGGFDASDPMAPFWTNYFNDPDLVLPAGHYRVFAVVDYDLDMCTAAETTLTAEVRFDVVDPAPSASPAG